MTQNHSTITLLKYDSMVVHYWKDVNIEKNSNGGRDLIPYLRHCTRGEIRRRAEYRFQLGGGGRLFINTDVAGDTSGRVKRSFTYGQKLRVLFLSSGQQLNCRQTENIVKTSVLLWSFVDVCTRIVSLLRELADE